MKRTEIAGEAAHFGEFAQCALEAAGMFGTEAAMALAAFAGSLVAHLLRMAWAERRRMRNAEGR